MSLVPTIYRSTDPGAPVISGQAGALAALLDAILVDGYGAGADYRAGLGWTREFLSPNLRAYRNNPVTGTGYYLRLDDANPLFGWMRAYESMSDIATGVNPVPTVAQRANGSMWIKSNQAGGAARPWFAIGNERCVYLFIGHTDQGVDYQVPYFVGDIASYVPNDQHCFALSQNGLTAYSSGLGSNITFQPMGQTWYDSPSINTSGLYIGRPSQGTAGSSLLGVALMAAIGVVTPYGGASGNPSYNFPSPVNGGVISLPGMLLERSLQVRGEYPGLRVPLATLAYGNETQVAEGVLSKRFRSTVSGNSTSANVGEVLFEFDREWR